MSSAFLRLIYPSSHIVSQKTTCRCLSLFTVWPAVSCVLSRYRIYDVYELEEIDNLARGKRDSGNRSLAVRKILQRDMLIIFLLFPYCFYDRKTMKMLERTTKCSFKRQILHVWRYRWSESWCNCNVHVLRVSYAAQRLTFCYRQTCCFIWGVSG